MNNWKRIVKTWNALPEADRTSDKVHAKLREQGHSIHHNQVQTVLCATVLSEMLDENDVSVTARTLKILLDVRSSSHCGRTKVSREYIKHAQGTTGPLSSFIGSSAWDLTQLLARILADYDEAVKFERQYDYIEEMNELREHSDDDLVPF